MGGPPHTFDHKPGSRLGKISRSHRRKRSPLKLKTENILPRGAPSKRLRYGGQNKTLVSFRLLLLVMLPGGKIIKNEEFRKKLSSFLENYPQHRIQPLALTTIHSHHVLKVKITD